jgi:hypothetical protein
VYQYWRRPLLLVQVKADNNRIRIFYVFTKLITDGDVACQTKCFFSFLPQILDVTKTIFEYQAIKLVMVKICL